MLTIPFIGRGTPGWDASTTDCVATRRYRVSWAAVTPIFLAVGCSSGTPESGTAERTPLPYATPEEVGVSAAALGQLTAEVTEWTEAGDLVGAEILLVKSGSVVYHEAFGWKDREAQSPMELNSVFGIQSITKTYTATAVLMLVEEGGITLDDPARSFVASVPDDDVRIRDLLTHTSGLDYRYAELPPPGVWFDSLREFVDGLEIYRAAPTGTFAYADLNYFLLGLIVEEVTGAPVERFIERRIFEPLGMNDSFTTYDPALPWAARVPSRYRFSEWAREIRRFRDSPLYETPVPWSKPWWPYFPAANGLYTTPMDHAAFMVMWLNGGELNGQRLLRPETVAEALRPHAERGLLDYYGLGWEVRDTLRTAGRPSDFRHGGIDGTMDIAFPDEDVVIIIFTQTAGDIAREAIIGRLGRLEFFDTPAAYGRGMVWAEHLDLKEVAQPTDPVRYVGHYLHESGGDGPVRIAHVVEGDDGRLEFQDWEATWVIPSAYDLVPLSEDRFTLGRYRGEVLEAVLAGSEVRFVEDSDGKRTIEIERSGDRFRAVAVEAAVAEEAQRRAQTRRGVDELVLGALDEAGEAAARSLSLRLHLERPDSVRFHPRMLDDLATFLGFSGRTADALAVLEMLVEAYPDLPAAYERAANGYRHAGRLDEAVASFRRAIALAEDQGSSSAGWYRLQLTETLKYGDPGAG